MLTLRQVSTLLVLCTLVLMTAAPGPGASDRLTIGEVFWSPSMRSLEVEVLMSRKLAEKASRKEFVLVLISKHVDAVGNVIGRLGPVRGEVEIADANRRPRGNEMIALAPLRLTYEDAAFDASAMARIRVELEDAKGKRKQPAIVNKCLPSTGGVATSC
jgi:hypothetical protein